MKLTNLLLFMVFMGSLFATDFIPSGDINGRGIYAIKNFTNISANNISAYIAYSYITGVPAYVINYSPIIDSIGNWSADKSSYTPTVNLPVYNNLSSFYVENLGNLTNYYNKTVVNTINTSSNILQLYASVQSDPQGFPDTTSTNANLHSTLTFNTATRNFTISPVGANYTYYFKGNLVTQTTNKSINITNISGVHIIYFDVNGVLQESAVLTEDILCNQVIVGAVVWSAPQGYQYIVQDERHTHFMECNIHYYLHEHLGTQYDSGLSPSLVTGGSSSLNSSAQMNVSAGAISDEDYTHDIAGYNSTTGGQFRVYYQIGQTNNWSIKTADSFPFVWSGDSTGYTGANSRIAYNLNTGGVWSLAQTSSNGNFVLAHFFATNSIDNTRDIVVVLGRAQYTTAALATTGATTEISSILGSGLFASEFKPLFTVLVQSSSSYANGPHAIFANPSSGTFIDWRRATLAGSSGTILAGTVTSVATGTGLTGGPITSTGTISIDDTYIQQFNDTAAISLLNGTVYSLGNWSADKSSYTTTANLPVYNNLSGSNVVSLVGNWSADKSSYWTSAITSSLGNWSGNISSYTTTANIPTLMGNSTIARTGTATCAAGTVAMNITTTTSGITSQCVVATTATGNVTASNATLNYVPFFTNSTNIANGRIYWNGTCLVNIGSTSTFNIC